MLCETFKGVDKEKYLMKRPSQKMELIYYKSVNCIIVHHTLNYINLFIDGLLDQHGQKQNHINFLKEDLARSIISRFITLR